MNRKETTKFLSDLLVQERLTGIGKYYAREISIDYGNKGSKRVDFMQFIPEGVTHLSEIEKGIFICYEVKSCIEDVYSGNGLNFYGEKNYIVTTMDVYKQLQMDMPKLYSHIRECNPESSSHFGFLIPVAYGLKPEDEYEKPTPLSNDIRWELKIILPCRHGYRKRAMTELLFCMLRSGH